MTGQTNFQALPGSFRDPSGHLFLKDGILYRQVNLRYKEDYDLLMNSGLYKALSGDGMLIPHIEAEDEQKEGEEIYKIIKPEPIPFVSFPYEWCFSQLKQAALITLRIQRKALDYGLILKDASAYNIQFIGWKPLFIDTLSFEKYEEGKPWVAYRQFCQHFLGPLALMSTRDARLNQLSRIYIDGIPLDLISSLLPLRTYFKFPLLSHIHLHAMTQKHYADKTPQTFERKFIRLNLLALLDNLESAVESLRYKLDSQSGINYYGETNYSSESMQFKQRVVDEFLNEIKPQSVFDFGANTGIFSRIASKKGIGTVSFDIVHDVVEKSYLDCYNDRDAKLLPLLLDMVNPSPGIGWENEERISLLERGPADAALALIHHLAISNNIPLEKIAHFFQRTCKALIIEFVPKSDSQVKRLLQNREDIFQDYTKSAFEKECEQYFVIKQAVQLKGSERTMYVLTRKY